MGGIVSRRTEVKHGNDHRIRTEHVEQTPNHPRTSNSSRPPLHPALTNSVAKNGHQKLVLNLHSPGTPTRSFPSVLRFTANPNIFSIPSFRDFALMSHTSQTPKDSNERAKYKYYCPLCMRHFEDILVTPCCSNYICLECSTGKYLITFYNSKAVSSHSYRLP